MGNNEIIIVVRGILCDSGLLSYVSVGELSYVSMRIHEGFGLGCGEKAFSFVLIVLFWFPSFIKKNKFFFPFAFKIVIDFSHMH